MINIFTVIALLALAALFFILENSYVKLAFQWSHAKGEHCREFQFSKASAIRCLWLARIFLIIGLILAVIEQYQFVGLE